MAIKVSFVSLGCPKNLIDTETMLYKLNEAGMELVADDINADVIVVNTCAFIQQAKEEAIETILDVAWLKKNKSLKGIVVAGCLSERYREQLFEELPEVDAVIGTGSYSDVIEAVNAAYKGEKYISLKSPDNSFIDNERVITTPDYFAYIKISEGCDNNCTYCVIPKLRGKFRSRQMSDIVAEVKQLSEIGVKEICLVGQDTTRYGEDIYGVYAFDSLLNEISKVDGIDWIRILYCYPDKITDSLIEEIATNEKVIKYIDMPIQHISDNVLRRMNRRGNSAEIKAVIEKLKSKIPDIVLRTTLIVGFPGETKEDFDLLHEFVKEGHFERLGVFSYSREEDTPAYNFSNQVNEKTKERRKDILMREQLRIHNRFNLGFVGKALKVICEGYDKVSESYFGRCYADAPDIDGKIFFSSTKKIKDGTFVDVEITEIFDYDLLGKAIII
ncbi:MAG: ribosomal protein S12 methylthiotransferase RimO [Clostridiales bacterium GWF2_38_85]|nr:MAG: ribosomal protein S12 methylthiotransferase RimO [Clostridiales bacterium GWF2_38_85]